MPPATNSLCVATRLRSVRSAAAFLSLFSLLFALPAQADKSSGTWTGQVETRGNYYWERSSRVVAPEVSVGVDSPSGIRVNAHYLIDTITSASVGAGALVDNRFTEIRHDFDLGAGYEFDFGSQQLDLGILGRMSTEPDYVSKAATVSAVLSLDERNTLFSLSATFLHDDVKSVLRTEAGTGDPLDVGNLNALVINVGWSQNLSPVATLSAGYDLGIMSGYLSNPYRSVSLGAAPVAEKHPNERLRNTANVRFAYYFPSTHTAIHALLRGYVDDWNINAITPEARIYQQIGDAFTLRLRYRYYVQTKAFFAQKAYTEANSYYTADQKMTQFTKHSLGTDLLIPLVFLENTALDFAWRASLDFTFEYVWNTNSFGDSTLMQVGLVVPY